MKRKLITGCVILGVIAVLIAVNILQSSGGVMAFSWGRRREVKVEKIKRQDITSIVSASGVVEETEKRDVYVEVPVKVLKVFVKEGDRVKAGDKLIEFDMDSLQTQYDSAKIEKRLQELALEKARDAGRKESLELSVEQAKNALKAAELELADSTRSYENMKKLFEAEAVSQKELDDAKKYMDNARIAMDNARIALQNAEIALRDGVSGLNNDINTLQEQVRLSNINLNEIEKKIKKINEASISPIDGAVLEVNVVDGGLVNPQMPVFRLVNVDKLQIKADVKEFDIRKVKEGQDVEITGDAIDEKTEITGKVITVASIAKTNKTATGEDTLIEVLVSIEKPDPVLKPGLNVTCKIITDVRQNVPVANFMMFRDDKDGNKSAFIVDEKGFIRQRNIILGITSELDAEVLSGLNEGDTVVINPQHSIKDGDRAKILKDTE